MGEAKKVDISAHALVIANNLACSDIQNEMFLTPRGYLPRLCCFEKINPFPSGQLIVVSAPAFLGVNTGS